MKYNATTFHRSRHLNDSELMPPTPGCPFCGSLNRQRVHILQEKPQVFLFKCNDCMATSASRLPTPEALNEYYRSYYSSPNFQYRVTFDDTVRFGRHLAQIFGQRLKSSSIRILDFGGGDGSLSVRTADLLIKKGCEKVEITVIDYNKTIVKFEDKRIAITHLDTIETLLPLTYDFVIASASIEHIPQLQEILFALFNLLKKEGVFYARTPYIMPIIHLSKFLGVNWDFTFPAHIYDLGQDFWESLFNDKITKEHFTILRSTPSIVETSFRNHFWITLFAYALKAPWYILGKRYTLVGGWEVLVRKNLGKEVTTWAEF